jgi:hypothetical protein
MAARKFMVSSLGIGRSDGGERGQIPFFPPFQLSPRTVWLGLTSETDSSRLLLIE